MRKEWILGFVLLIGKSLSAQTDDLNLSENPQTTVIQDQTSQEPAAQQSLNDIPQNLRNKYHVSVEKPTQPETDQIVFQSSDGLYITVNRDLVAKYFSFIILLESKDEPIPLVEEKYTASTFIRLMEWVNAYDQNSRLELDLDTFYLGLFLNIGSEPDKSEHSDIRGAFFNEAAKIILSPDNSHLLPYVDPETGDLKEPFPVDFLVDCLTYNPEASAQLYRSIPEDHRGKEWLRANGTIPAYGDSDKNLTKGQLSSLNFTGTQFDFTYGRPGATTRLEKSRNQDANLIINCGKETNVGTFHFDSPPKGVYHLVIEGDRLAHIDGLGNFLHPQGVTLPNNITSVDNRFIEFCKELGPHSVFIKRGSPTDQLLSEALGDRIRYMEPLS